jgi:hypothetical protein
MKRISLVLLLVIFITSGVFSQTGFRGRPITNNISMPTGYTLNQNEFLIGLGPIGFGITNNIQIGTNILLYLFQVYNGNIKISFIKTESMAFAAGFSIKYFNLDVFGAEENFIALSPYVVVSPRIGSKTLLHIGGQYVSFSSDANIDDAEIESTTDGTRLFLGLEQSISNKTKFLVEGGYDIDFEGFTIGGAVLFGWKSFRLKLGVTIYNPKDFETFTLPIIGLWWRFNA